MKNILTTDSFAVKMLALSVAAIALAVSLSTCTKAEASGPADDCECDTGTQAPPVSDDQKGMIFLFQGNSITDGNWGITKGSTNRNYTDKNHYLGHGYAYNIASRMGADFPGAGFVFHNRGVAGDQVSDLQMRWDTDALAIDPDVLSIMIGANNMIIRVEHGVGDNAAAYETKLRDLCQRSRTKNPDVLLVVCTPFFLPVGNYQTKWAQYSAELEGFVAAAKKVAGEFDAVLVDLNARFTRAAQSEPPETWLFDGCHPTPAGHELIAREWIKKVGARLEFLKAYDY